MTQSAVTNLNSLIQILEQTLVVMQLARIALHNHPPPR